MTQVNVPHFNPSHIGHYLIYLPWRDGRLSLPWWLVTYWDGLPVHRQSSIEVVTRRRVKPATSWLLSPATYALHQATVWMLETGGCLIAWCLCLRMSLLCLRRHLWLGVQIAAIWQLAMMTGLWLSFLFFFVYLLTNVQYLITLMF